MSSIMLCSSVQDPKIKNVFSLSTNPRAPRYLKQRKSTAQTETKAQAAPCKQNEASEIN